MRVRLFWQLLATFGLLIVFAIGATTALNRATFRDAASETFRPVLASGNSELIARLAEYYVRQGNSWVGAQRELDAWLANNGSHWGETGGYVLFDESGQVAARGGKAATLFAGASARWGTPIYVDGEQIGSVLFAPTLRAAGSGLIPSIAEQFSELHPIPTVVMPELPETPLEPAAPETGRTFHPPWMVEREVDRSLGFVALAIGSVTFGLAVLMSGRISAPLAGLTQAARQVAAGRWDVQVPSSSIKEVDALARAFNQMAADLQHADHLRRNMTADIAHELRTPLTIIKGKLEGILDGVYPSTADHIVPVLEEATLLERLIDDLRLLSLAEAGQLPLYRDEVPVKDLLEDVRGTFATEAAQHQVTLSVEAPPDVGALAVDPQRMQQVLGNLVANSLRYTPPGGRIDLTARAHGDVVSIAIADSGSGIAPDDVPHIFDRFWRGDKARARNGNSAGLGLAIARQLVEAHGGGIAATSKLGYGTTITVELPRHAAA